MSQVYYPNVTIDQLERRILPKIRVDTTGCWNWTGANNGRYAHWAEGFKKRGWRVHRLMYALTHGVGMEDRDDIVVDHICNNTLCVRPSHLQMITQAENLARIPSKDGSHIGWHVGNHELKPGDIRINKKRHYNGTITESKVCRPCERLYRTDHTTWRRLRNAYLHKYKKVV